MVATLPKPRRLIRLGVMMLLLAGASGVALSSRTLLSRETSNPALELPRVRSARRDLHVSLNAPGTISSSVKTLIEAEIEALSYSNEGRSIWAGGASTIIKLMPEGTMVAEGDVLCELDSASYRELVRQQAIEVEESRAEQNESRLDLEAEVIRLREYRDGTLDQLKQRYQGQIALAEAEFNRQRDRVVWTQRMVELQYLPSSRLRQENNLLQRNEIELDRSRLAYKNLLEYTAPKVIAALEARIYSLQSVLTYREMRLKRDEEALARYEEQVRLCTIRAPHAGFLIYANEEDDDTRVELGSRVRQRQDLFFLPDLTRMEVETELHESVVNRVEPGMAARVRVEAMPHLSLEGHVVSVAPLPQSPRSYMTSQEVRTFAAKVQLDVVPEGLLPGMTAEVDIETANRPDAVVVPSSALAVDEGSHYCYVASAGGLERREVEIGVSTLNEIEITRGLDANEEVVFDASLVEPDQAIERKLPPPPTSLADVGLDGLHVTPAL